MNKNFEAFDLKEEEKDFLVYLLGTPGSKAQPLNQRKSIISDFSDPKKEKKEKRKKNKVSQDEIKQLMEHEQELQLLLQTEV